MLRSGCSVSIRTDNGSSRRCKDSCQSRDFWSTSSFMSNSLKHLFMRSDGDGAHASIGRASGRLHFDGAKRSASCNLRASLTRRSISSARPSRAMSLRSVCNPVVGHQDHLRRPVCWGNLVGGLRVVFFWNPLESASKELINQELKTAGCVGRADIDPPALRPSGFDARLQSRGH